MASKKTDRPALEPDDDDPARSNEPNPAQPQPGSQPRTRPDEDTTDYPQQPGPGPGQPGQPQPGSQPPPEPPVRTIADEQRERSEEIQRDGVEAFKAKANPRDPNAGQTPVPGVGNPQVESFRR